MITSSTPNAMMLNTMDDRRISKTVANEKNAGLMEPITSDKKTITENVMNS